MIEVLHENTNSICWALLLGLNPLAWILSPYFSNPLLILSLVVLTAYTLGCKKKFSRSVIALVVFCVVCFLVSMLRESHTNPFLNKYFIEFLALGAFPLFVSQNKPDINKTILYLSIISVLAIPATIQTVRSAEDPGALMGVSYGCLRMVLGLSFYFLLSRSKHHKVLSIVFGIVLIWYLAFLVPFASRGSVLAFMVFLVLIVVARQRHIPKSAPYMVVLFAVVVVLAFDPLVSWVNGFLNHYGVSIGALDKIIRLQETGNVDNGRLDIFRQGIAFGLENPVFGNGIGSFEFKYQIGWVHDIFVQLFLEGGLILLLPFVLIIIMSFRFIFDSTIRRDERELLVFLMCSGLIELLFSSYLWRSQVFWLYIGYTIKLWSRNKRVRESTYHQLKPVGIYGRH